MIKALIVLVVLAGCGKKDHAANAPIKVAAAADLAFAFKEVGDAFTKKTGKQVKFTFGSTGNLAKQIAEGAPYDVLAAANVSFVDDVVKAGACDAATKAMYARGRIVVWTKGPATELAQLADAKFVKIAIANPEHAPYGKAAKQALEKAGIWDQVQPRLVLGENVQATMQYAKNGAVRASIPRCTSRSIRRWSCAATASNRMPRGSWRSS